jgi:flagellar basal-body rod protein FlgB
LHRANHRAACGHLHASAQNDSAEKDRKLPPNSCQTTKDWRKIRRTFLIFKGLLLAYGLPSENSMLGITGAQLERYMDLLSARQKLVASNIANVDTPGYRTQDIDFQAEFRNAVGSIAHPQAVEGLAVRNDGNNVSIDRETRLLSENALRFQAASSLLHSQVQLLRLAIKEGQST